MEHMTLQTIRNLEHFLGCIEFSDLTISDSMSFNMKNHMLYIECINNVVSFTVTMNKVDDISNFERLFEMFNPLYTYGYVLRVVKTLTKIGINFVFPENSHSELYYKLYKVQVRFVETYLKQRF